MKKIIALLLAIFMLLSLCACGNDKGDTSGDLQNNQQTTDNSSEKGEEDTVDLSTFTTMDEVMNYLATFIDTSKYGNDDIPEDENTDRRELLVKEPTTMANEITISGKLLKFPLSYDELISHEDFTITDFSGGGANFDLTLADKDNKEFSVLGETKENMNRISFFTYKENSPQFVYMKSITNKATPKTIVEKLGLPQQIYVHKNVSVTDYFVCFEIKFFYRDADETHQLQFDFSVSGGENINGLKTFYYSSLD